MKFKDKLVHTTAEQLTALHPDIPEEKLPGIVARTLLGALITIIGLVLIAGATIVTLRLLYESKTPGVLGFVALAAVGGAGLFLFAFGLLTAAGRLVKQPLRLAVATFRGIVAGWRKP